MIDDILSSQGYVITKLEIPPEITSYINDQDWKKLDQTFLNLTLPSGSLFQLLRNYATFQSIEFIISIRDASDKDQEDGIWHDDGSRLMAFSLSLTQDDVEGGILGFKKKGQETQVYIPTPSYGEMIIFLTGVHGYEHKIYQVTKGRRIVIAGWCS